MVTETDDATMQAACIVEAMDAYLAMFPWPVPTLPLTATFSIGDRIATRKRLIDTFAATIRMSEPRRSELQHKPE